MDFDILPKWLQELPFGADNDSNSGPSDGNSEGSNGVQSNQQGNQQDSQNGNKSSGNGKESTNSSDNDDDEFSGLSAADLRRRLKEESTRTKSLETERDSFKTKVDEAERAQRSKEENLENDLANARKENEDLRAINDHLAVTNAILMDSAYNWHDVSLVSRELNYDVVKVSSDGKVEGLKKELQRLAKDKAFLLKAPAQQQNSGNGSNGPTGFQPGQGGANNGGNTEKANIAELAEKFPALASRVR